jgi:hypothetical protein
MNGENQNFQGGREINYLAQKDTYLGSFCSRVVDAINQLAVNAGVTAVGKTSPPPKIDSIQVQGTQVGDTVTCPSEILHHTLTHNQSIGKGISYFSEIDTTPSFTQPHVISHGTSRSSFLTLPTYESATDQSNSVKATYYLRSYAQMPGSDPCAPTVLGNLGGPTKIQMTPPTGSTGSAMALLSSTGSGTAQSSGQQGGQGLGTVLRRPTTQPKRLAKRF